MQRSVSAYANLTGGFSFVAMTAVKKWKLKQMWPNNTILNIVVLIICEKTWETSRKNKSNIEFEVAFAPRSSDSKLSWRWHHVFWIRCARYLLVASFIREGIEQREWKCHSLASQLFWRPYGNEACLSLWSLNRKGRKDRRNMREQSNVTCLLGSRLLFHFWAENSLLLDFTSCDS